MTEKQLIARDAKRDLAAELLKGVRDMKAGRGKVVHAIPSIHGGRSRDGCPPNPVQPDPSALLDDIRKLIEASRQRAALAVNAELTLLFWRIGHRIYTEVLAGRRAGYGEEILPSLATQLTLDYGRGFGEKNLRRMVKLAAMFPDERIVATVSRQLSST